MSKEMKHFDANEALVAINQITHALCELINKYPNAKAYEGLREQLLLLGNDIMAEHPYKPRNNDVKAPTKPLKRWNQIEAEPEPFKDFYTGEAYDPQPKL